MRIKNRCLAVTDRLPSLSIFTQVGRITIFALRGVETIRLRHGVVFTTDA